jgi:hypothetical protein
LHRPERLRSRACGEWLLRWIGRDVIIVIAGAPFTRIVAWLLRRRWASRWCRWWPRRRWLLRLQVVSQRSIILGDYDDVTFWP